MKTISKSCICDEFVNKIPNLCEKVSKNIMEEILLFIRSELSEGKRFPIKGVGRITVRAKSERPGRNPRTGEETLIKPRISVSVVKNSSNKEKPIKNTLSKRDDFYDAIRDKFNLTKKDTITVYETFIGIIKGVLDGKTRIEIRNFGTFEHNILKPKLGRNPKTGEIISIPEKVRLHFRESDALRFHIEKSGNFGEFSNQ